VVLEVFTYADGRGSTPRIVELLDSPAGYLHGDRPRALASPHLEEPRQLTDLQPALTTSRRDSGRTLPHPLGDDANWS